MQTQYGFLLMSISEFATWLKNLRLARTVIYIQQHHTYSPNYMLFRGDNHFSLQRGMYNYHVNANGWSDIGQHFTIFPDGSVMTGRTLEKSPACIYGNNSEAICIENLGNFDTNGDTMSAAQRDAIVQATALLCNKFNIPVNTDKIVYHHWFKLSNGVRNNGRGGNKSCPGTQFFGGNKVEDCERNFIPLVTSSSVGAPSAVANDTLLKYVCVWATHLNVRVQPSGRSAKVKDRDPALFGAILRVYDEQNGWYKISSSKNHWVYSRYTTDVLRATINTDSLNVRNQPSIQGLRLGAATKNQEIFIVLQHDGWSKISLEEKWVKTSFITIE